MQSTAHGIRRNEERAEEADRHRDDGEDGQACDNLVEGTCPQDRDAENHRQDNNAHNGFAGVILQPVWCIVKNTTGESYA